MKQILEYVKKHGRLLDYLLIKNLDSPCEDSIIEELLKYQNDDGGFGHGLEPDLTCPESSVLATNIATTILDDIKCSEKLHQQICSFFISKFDGTAFEFIPKEAQNYPRAIWWGSDTKGELFNPTPEVLGYLYKYRHLHSFNVEEEITKITKLIKDDYTVIGDEHSLYSVLRLIEDIDYDENLIEAVYKFLESIIVTDKSKWDSYVASPYKLISPEQSIYDKYKDIVDESLEHLLSKRDIVWMPEWQWYQFDDVWEKAKFEWMGYTTYERLKVLKKFNKQLK